MLEETQLKISGYVKGKPSIQDALKKLSALHGVKQKEIGYCVDGVAHDEFGRNRKFTAMQEKATGAVHLTKVTEDNSFEVIHYKYLASLLHKGMSREGRERYVHFYRKR